MALADCDPPADNFAAIDPTFDVPNVVFTAIRKSQDQAGGAVVAMPALQATWDASTNPYVIGVQFRWVPTSFSGATNVSGVRPVSTLAAGDWDTTDGIVSEAVYDCYYKAIGPGGKESDWIGPTSVTMLSISLLNVRDFLGMIKPNLYTWAMLAVSNGAAKVDPFTDPPVVGAFGEQLMAITIPGGGSGVYITRDGGTQGLATVGDNGAAYNFCQKFVTTDLSGSVIRCRWVDQSNNPITGISDLVMNLTTTPTDFPWEDVYSDDADFTTAKQEWYVNPGDIAGGETVTGTEFMAQTDDFFDPHGLWMPFRPSIDELDIERYGPLAYQLYRDALAADPNFTIRSNGEGNGTMMRPPGMVRVLPVSGTSYTLTKADTGLARRFTNASPSTVTVPAKSSLGADFFNGPGVVSIIADNAAVTVVEDTGVVVTPMPGGTLTIPAGGMAQLFLVETRDTPEGRWKFVGDWV